jgi:hypothetical protein
MTADGPRYPFRCRKPDRRQTDKRGFQTKRAAEAFANTVEVRKLTGEFTPEKAGRITVGELAPVFLDRKRQSTAPPDRLIAEMAALWSTVIQRRA